MSSVKIESSKCGTTTTIKTQQLLRKPPCLLNFKWCSYSDHSDNMKIVTEKIVTGNWEPSRCIMYSYIRISKLLVQNHCYIIKQLLVISRNTLTTLTSSDSESWLTFVSYRQTGNLSSLFLFCGWNRSQHPTFKMNKWYDLVCFFFSPWIFYREWLEFSDVKHHLYTLIHF